MKCQKCGFELEGGQSFCPNCGQKVQQFCCNCRTELQQTQKYCPNCGQAAGQTENMDEKIMRREKEIQGDDGGTYTESGFLEVINELASKDEITNLAIKFCGTKVMKKELLPILQPGEKVIAISNVHKISIDKYAKEFLVVTTKRVLEISKGGGIPGSLLPAKVKVCNISQISSIETGKALIGETLTIRTNSFTFKSTLTGKGSGDTIKGFIEAQR